MAKAVSQIISTVFIILLTFVTVSLVLMIGKPAIDRAKEAGVINEAQKNMETLDKTIREVAYEGRGSYRTVQLRVTDGDYRIFNYSGNFTGAIQYKLESNFNNLPRLSIVKESDVKYSTGVNTMGLVGYWKFDDGGGSNVSDSSGNGNTGYVNDSTWITNTSCKYGNCLYFDGSNDYVNVNDKSEFSGGHDLTVEVWFKANVLGGSQTNPKPLVMKYLNANYKDWGLGIANSKIFFGSEDNGNDWDTNNGLNGKTTLSTNTWYYAAFTYTNSTRLVKVYVNGVEENSTTLSFSTTDSSANVEIGRDGYKEDYFNGMIDDVHIYYRALTSDEITANYVAKASDYQAVLEYNRTFIQGKDRFGKGTQLICIEKTGVLEKKAILSITNC